VTTAPLAPSPPRSLRSWARLLGPAFVAAVTLLDAALLLEQFLP